MMKNKTIASGAAGSGRTVKFTVAGAMEASSGTDGELKVTVVSRVGS